MATKKKKKTGHKTYHHYKKVSGMNDTLSTIASVAAGAVVAKVITKVLPSTTVSPTIVAIGTIGAGIFVPKLVKGPFGAGLGSGMIAVGTVNTLSAFGVLSGTPIPVRPMVRQLPAPMTRSRLSGGLNNLSTLNGTGLSNLKTVNGTGVLPSYAGDNDLC